MRRGMERTDKRFVVVLRNRFACSKGKVGDRSVLTAMQTVTQEETVGERVGAGAVRGAAGAGSGGLLTSQSSCAVDLLRVRLIGEL